MYHFQCLQLASGTMTIDRASSIGRLLKEKFPDYFALLQQHENKDLLLAVVNFPSAEIPSFGTAKEFHRELIAMPDKQLEKADIQRKIRAVREQDANHTLNGFLYEAHEGDFEFYARAALWEIEEAAALFVGRNPKTFNSSTIGSFRAIPNSASTFKSYLDLLERACSIRQLNRSDRPGKFLGWAESVGIDVPAELKELVLKYNHLIVAPPNLYPRSEPDNSNVGAQTPKVSSEIAASTTEKDLKQRERTSLLKLVIGMAIGGYAFDPTAKRSDTVPDIRNDLERCGLSLDEQTIRRYLREGVEMLPRDIQDAK